MTTDPTPSWDDLGALAARLATEAGALVIELADEARGWASTKSSATDVVTLADTTAEELIVRGLRSARPDDGLEGEEGASVAGSSGVVWHIDPIDGTTNFLYAVPAFSVSIAAAINDEVVAGVVYDPSGELLYQAVKGAGATCNGQPLACSSLDELSTALVATGFGYRAEQRRHQATMLVEVIPRIRDIRRFGSAALDLCAVARGHVDAYYEQGLNRWDLAAGALVAAESGATVGNLTGGRADATLTLASAPSLFEPLKELLVTAGINAEP